MARAINRLTVRQVASLRASGRHADGGGLYLRITPKGARSWVFMTTGRGKRTEIGLGAAVDVSLATARRLAAEMREAVATGRDPRAVIAPNVEEGPRIVTFGDFAETYIAGKEVGWRNEVHRQQWRHSLRAHAAALMAMPIAEIGTDDVRAVLEPIWTTKPETADRVRGRIERILAGAMANGLRSRDAINPAIWKGHLSEILPKKKKLTRGHHAALDYRDAPDFMVALRKRPALAARCLEFLILTAARSGEALGATWGEIDRKRKLWVVPPDRMKAGVEHEVPLSDAAIALLARVRPSEPKPTDLVFAIDGAARSNMAMSMLLRRMGYDGARKITVHGFRSSFKQWARGKYADDLSEEALAHIVGSKARRAYARGELAELRRPMMSEWAGYLAGEAVAGGGPADDADEIVAALTAGQPLTPEQAARVAAALGTNRV
ncbi:tyrosine-type recombinase/integrase [Hephaestia sp. GCM10023244]|uniref:tyrosine-type recombinase/integrase n=1 Tax=unclassified Hephaestia TaxID=2631281 RepID=UPI0020770034|nr:site-specific integrase [Hephaestia sp. MAHUQ-44]MCM8731429.1 integrase arm-type DNA-binding domain-containing protein [Hephaestia sp. MAHUQ-44]